MKVAGFLSIILGGQTWASGFVPIVFLCLFNVHLLYFTDSFPVLVAFSSVNLISKRAIVIDHVPTSMPPIFFLGFSHGVCPSFIFYTLLPNAFIRLLISHPNFFWFACVCAVQIVGIFSLRSSIRFSRARSLFAVNDYWTFRRKSSLCWLFGFLFSCYGFIQGLTWFF